MTSETTQKEIKYFSSINSVRETCTKVFNLAEKGELKYWQYDQSKEQDAIKYCAKLLERDFGTDYSSIPPHSRWRHFGDRLEPLIEQWKQKEQIPPIEIGRRLIDLFVVSVLLDAGAGPDWKYYEVGKPANSTPPVVRSEGLAVASLDMYKQGLFSSDKTGDPLRVDALGLSNLTVEMVKTAMQVDDRTNPMVGIQGRAELLVKLGAVLKDPSNSKYFAKNIKDLPPQDIRPGNIIDYLLDHPESSRLPAAASSPMEVKLPVIWDIIINGLGGVWPKTRTILHGQYMGDVWPCEILKQKETSSPDLSSDASGLVAFHKLSQWLTYSLLEVLTKELRWHISGIGSMTGLPEYRNGGLLIDLGIMTLNRDAVRQSLGLSEDQEIPPFPASHPAIVEWRAMTVITLDRIQKGLNQLLKADLSLPQVLESCTWKGGRELAKEKRKDGGPPIDVQLDGTVF